MKRGLLLSACWAVLAFLLVPGVGRGAPPPDCEDCECYEAEAWLEIWFEGNPLVQKTGNPAVLKQWDKDDPEKYGAVLKDARWKSVDHRRVYATPCLKDFSEEEKSTTYKRLAYTENWQRACKLTATQTGSFYQPVVFVESVNYSQNEDKKRFWCGPQD